VAEARWIREAEVCALLDLREAIDALETGLKLEAKGTAQNMQKTLATFGGGGTLHALGAIYEGLGLVGTKTWAHSAGGATPLLLLWDAESGALRAVIEAFALGQLRTASMSGVATRWMARTEASVMAVIGTGKQALPQVAAVHAVRPLRELRVMGRDPGRRRVFATRLVDTGFRFAVIESQSVSEAVDGADVVTAVTRAEQPFLEASMLGVGSHVNAVGAISLSRQEFAQDLFPRCAALAADNPETVRALSREFNTWASLGGDWERLRPLSELVAAGRKRDPAADLTLFKSMGMGISDLAVGAEVLIRAEARGLGRPIPQPERAKPKLL
jgi:ornithine cyclodeaminase